MSIGFIKVGPETVVNSGELYERGDPSITGLANGGWVVAWRATGGTLDTDVSGIEMRLVDALGNPVGNVVLANSDMVGDQRLPAITALPGGKFVVTWTGNEGSSSTGIKGMIFDSAGNPQGSEFLVNTRTDGDQTDSAVAPLAGGGFLVAWVGTDLASDPSVGGAVSPGIRGQLFDAIGNKVGSEFGLNDVPAGREAPATCPGPVRLSAACQCRDRRSRRARNRASRSPCPGDDRLLVLGSCRRLQSKPVRQGGAFRIL